MFVEEVFSAALLVFTLLIFFLPFTFILFTLFLPYSERIDSLQKLTRRGQIKETTVLS